MSILWYRPSREAFAALPANGVRRCFNRTGGTIARGTVLKLDTAFSAVETTDFIFSSQNGCWANVVAITPGGGPRTGTFLVALESFADDMLGDCLLYGVADVIPVVSDATPANWLRGTRLTPDATNGVLTSAFQTRITARGELLSAKSSGASENVSILFDGTGASFGTS